MNNFSDQTRLPLRKKPPLSRLRIIVTGYMFRFPLGGNAWVYLQYVLGFSRLGHEVIYVEEVGGSAGCCYDPNRNVSDNNYEYALEFADTTFERYSLSNNWAIYDAYRELWVGPCSGRILDVCASADLFVSVSGVDKLRPWFENISVRVLVDTDPVFTQIRNLTDLSWHEDTARYTTHLSFGENIARGASEVPDDGFPWQATRPPIVLEVWPVTCGRPKGMYRTVMKWESYEGRRYADKYYGMKAEAIEPYIGLPRETASLFELAVTVGAETTEKLLNGGWNLGDPLKATRDLATYQSYIQASKAEFSVAKHGYVVSRSGWFSDRSAAYLASGRPVVVQETGFSDWLEVGAGVFAFSSEKQAVTGINEINAKYEYHCRAAREIAIAYFDANEVLSRIIETAFSSKMRSFGM